jgi:exonuclease SbcD
MRIVHMSDTHIGYRAYNRINSQGVNQREWDVAETFKQAVSIAGERDPDLVVITGDLFHTVRPSNYSLLRAYRLLNSLQRKREGKPLVIIAGNHETPRSSEAGCILALFENLPGTTTVFDRIRTVEAGQASILCIPSRGVFEIERTVISPDSGAKVNVLLMHGILEGVADFDLAHPISRQKILSDAWDYIGMGDWHLSIKIADNAYYAGATDFTSNNIWEESYAPKGVIEFDTQTCEMVFHPLKTRAVIDLPLIDAHELTADEVNEMMARYAENAKIEDAIVRQRVFNLSHSVRIGLSGELLRDLRARALHYQFDPRAPRVTGSSTYSPGDSTTHERRTLEDEWKIFAAVAALPQDVNRERLIQTGLDYLSKAEV